MSYVVKQANSRGTDVEIKSFRTEADADKFVKKNNKKYGKKLYVSVRGMSHDLVRLSHKLVA